MQCTVLKLPPNQATLTCYVQDGSAALSNAEIRPAALIFPGGGYQYCSDREAEPVALAYLAQGYNAFVLRYTTGQDCPLDRSLQDAQAALRYLRANAAELHINPHKIAAIGFSAGGHLAAALGTQSEEKPDAMVLGYAVTLGSTWALDGRAQEPDLGDLVTDSTPPAFIFATQGDTLVPVKNSLVFADALADHDIPFALHIFPTGGHGLSLARASTCGGDPGRINDEAARWLPMSVRFLQKVWGELGMVAPDAELSAQLGQGCPGLDMPFKRLLKNPAAAKVLQRRLPEVMGILQQNPLLAGASLRELAGFAPDAYPESVLRSIDEELARCADQP